MKTQTLTLHVPLDEEIKQKAMRALAGIGLSAPDAVRLLFHRIAFDQTFPPELKAPNAETRRAMAEIDEIVKARKARFSSADEISPELEEVSDQ